MATSRKSSGNTTDTFRKRAEHDRPVKVVLLGDSAVGKTNLLFRFVYDDFSECERSRKGVLPIVRSLFVKEAMADVELEIWDSIEQERFQEADAVIVVFDITNIDSFVGAKNWIDKLEEHAQPRPVIILVGNKRDLLLKRMVSPFHSESYANEKGVLFKETSAKTAHNVREIFYEAVRLLVIRSNESRNSTRDIVASLKDGKDGKRKRRCCF